MKQDSELSIYDLMKDWFNFCFENPELINPNHSAMYFFILEHNNRLGWKPKFGLPMQMAMDAIGIRNNRTYMKAFTDLVEWGFIIIYQRSKNQYSANVVGIVKNTKANTKALAKATQKQQQKQRMSIAHIDIPITNIPITKLQEGEREKKSPPENHIFEKVKTTFNIPLDECKQQFLSDELHLSRLCKNLEIQLSDLKFWIIQFFIQQENEGVVEKSLLDTKSHFGRWISIKLEKQNGRKEEKPVYD